MKVGILTFQYAINYGAVMQLYSLQNTVAELGYPCSVINYIPTEYHANSLRTVIRNSGIKNSSKNYTTILSRIFHTLLHQHKLGDFFGEFSDKYFRLTDSCNDQTWPGVFNTLDTIIVGSDQVWNPTNQNGDIYFLNHPSLICRKVAYAADSTTSSVSPDNKARLSAALRDFYSISVRNQHSQIFVENVMGEQPIIVPDPVIISDFSEFSSPCRTDCYALVYLLGDQIPGGHHKIVSEIRKNIPGIKIIQVMMCKQYEYAILSEADERLYRCSPEKWVSLIANAAFVYTDSFHCVLFALKFHRNFLAYYSEENRAPRLLDLQKRYKLGNKIVSSAEEAISEDSFHTVLDYQHIDEKFKQQKDSALIFLKHSLGEPIDERN